MAVLASEGNATREWRWEKIAEHWPLPLRPAVRASAGRWGTWRGRSLGPAPVELPPSWSYLGTSPIRPANSSAGRDLVRPLKKAPTVAATAEIQAVVRIRPPKKLA